MISEQEVLKIIKKIIPKSNHYLKDDVAIINLNGKKIIYTTDTITENTHFTLKSYKPDEIGYKAMSVNLSDIASVGGTPKYALVALSIPKNLSGSFIQELYTGIQNCAKRFKTQIIGGNISRSKELSITITLIGEVNKNTGLRSNAKAGDIVFVSGNFGDSSAGLYCLNKKITDYHLLLEKQKLPEPKVNLGKKISSLISKFSLMDASDGLADCLIQIARESKVKVTIFEESIPISKELISFCKRYKFNPLNFALYGGEDYELVGTTNKNNFNKLKKSIQIKAIGVVTSGNSAYLKQKNNKLVKLNIRKSYQHFY